MALIPTFEGYCKIESLCDASSLAEDLAQEVFWSSSLGIPNWILLGWINLLNGDDDSDDEGEPLSTCLIDEALSCTVGAMQAIYNTTSVTMQDSVLQALKWTLECREALHDTAMSRLNQPELTSLQKCTLRIAMTAFDRHTRY